MIVFLLILIVLILCMGSREFNAMAKTIGLVLLFTIFFVTGINIIGMFYTIMICLILGILLFVKVKRC